MYRYNTRAPRTLYSGRGSMSEFKYIYIYIYFPLALLSFIVSLVLIGLTRLYSALLDFTRLYSALLGFLAPSPLYSAFQLSLGFTLLCSAF